MTEQRRPEWLGRTYEDVMDELCERIEALEAELQERREAEHG